MQQSHPTEIEVLCTNPDTTMTDTSLGAVRALMVRKAPRTPHGEGLGLLGSSADDVDQRGCGVQEILPQLVSGAVSGTAMLDRVERCTGPRRGSILTGGVKDFHCLRRTTLILTIGGALTIAGAVASIALLGTVWIGGVASALLIAVMSAIVAGCFRQSRREALVAKEAFNVVRRRLEDERRERSRRVLAAQEAERLRIARELHDEIGQTLTAVALRAEHTAHGTAGQHPELAELVGIVQQALADVRRISLELRPAALDELGLINSLISLCARVQNESPVRVHRHLEGPIPDLPRDIELAVYRIAQEALTNVMRHSGASAVDVLLSSSDGELVLSVRDNGCGLPNDLRESGGLTGMRERAMLIGADLEVGSTSAGVSVTLRRSLQ